jgi:exonuclease SbcC
MVKLLKLQTLNFKKTNVDPPLQLPDGVTLVCGPNESGKSTILDAILYALYARVIRPKAIASVEQLVAYGKNHAIVRLDFSIGDKVYRVDRQLYLNRTSTATLWEVLEEGQLRVLATGQKQVSDQIERLLAGISYNEILASTVVAQKDLEHLVKQGPGDRKKVINAFMNLESFNTVLDSQNEARKDLEGTTARPGRLTTEKRNLDEKASRVDQYNKSLKEVEDLERDIKNLEKDIVDSKEGQEKVDELYATLKNYKDAVDRKEMESTKIEEKEKLVEQLRDQLRKLSKVETQITDTTKDLGKYADLDGAEEKLEGLQDTLDEAKAVSAKLEDSKKRRREASGTITELKKKLPASIDQQKIAHMEPKTGFVWLTLSGAIACFFFAFILLAVGTSLFISLFPMILGAVAILFVARQMLVGSKLRTILLDIRTLREKRLDLEKFRKQVNDFEKEKTKCEKDILSTCESIRRYSSVLSKTKTKGSVAIAQALSNALNKDKTEKDRLEQRLRDLQEQIKEKASTEENLGKNEETLEKLKSERAKIRLPELPRGVEFSEELFEKTSEERNRKGKDLRGREQKLEDDENQCKKVKQFIKENQDLPDKVKEQTELVTSLEHDLNVAKTAIAGLEKTAEALRSRVKPYVEQYMELILPAITNGRYKAAELDEDYNLKVWDPDAGEFKSREVFSGGTEDQFLLSMRLAFAVALLPEIKGMHPEFLFLDEPLGSSDDARRQGILELLSTELSSKFKQIFLISHVGNLEAEVRNLIRLENGQVTEVVTG